MVRLVSLMEKNGLTTFTLTPLGTFRKIGAVKKQLFLIESDVERARIEKVLKLLFIFNVLFLILAFCFFPVFFLWNYRDMF